MSGYALRPKRVKFGSPGPQLVSPLYPQESYVASRACQVRKLPGGIRLISCRSKMRGKGLPARRLSISLKMAFYAFTVRSHPGQAV